MDDELTGVLGTDRIGYDPMAETYHERHDWDGPETLPTTIVRAAAAVDDTEPTELEQLSNRIDPEACETVLQSLAEGGSRGHVRFSYVGYEVTVASTGEICIDCDP